MFNIIVAFCRNRGIGNNNIIPWNIKQDMKYFKNITSNKEGSKKNAIIMGRKTWDSLQIKPLKDRYNFVLSKNNNLSPKILMKQLEYNDNINDIFVIGGEEIYRLYINDIRCKNIYVTYIDNFYECNKYFPKIPIWFEINKLHTYKSKEINVTNIIYKNKLYDFESQEYNYLNIIKKVIQIGNRVNTRNGITYSIFGETIEFDISNSFPLLTTKKMFIRAIIEELLFFIRGETDTKILEKKNINIWKHNTKETNGNIGPMYGYVWRNFNENIDQLKNLIISLNNDINSRRHIITTYNPSYNEKSVLYPCHGLITQFNIENNKLNCCMYQRSADIGLGLPFNIASYSLLVYILCNTLKNNIKPGKLKIFIGDAHIYEEHIKDLKMQTNRIPFIFPKIICKKKMYNENINIILKNIEELKYEDFILENYIYHPSIKMPIK